MDQTILSITYIALFIPGVLVFYYLLQCFDYEKTIKKGKAQYFKTLYILICIILSALLAWSVVHLLEEIGSFIIK